MNKLKQILKYVSSYLPSIFLIFMVYLSKDNAVDNKLGTLIPALIMCFLFIGHNTLDNNNEVAALRQEIEELKQMKNL